MFKLIIHCVCYKYTYWLFSQFINNFPSFDGRNIGKMLIPFFEMLRQSFLILLFLLLDLGVAIKYNHPFPLYGII